MKRNKMAAQLAYQLTSCWYRRPVPIISYLLLPFAGLFGLITALRRQLYRWGVLRSYHFPVPVIVVGNITVGGTGKTPFVIWLAQYLLAQGYRPGIVSRGVGGKKHLHPHTVLASDLAQQVGDEALLLLQNTQCPVVIGIDRVAAVQTLLEEFQCNVVISDDGLQHYRLSRNIEIVMVDASLCFGNHYLLPAGPLREPVSRLLSVDMIVMNGSQAENESTPRSQRPLCLQKTGSVLGHLPWAMQLSADQLVSICDPQKKVPVHAFSSKKVHAVAGIGHPERFFTTLTAAGFDIIAHAFPDHYSYQAKDLNFRDTLSIIMTEKDAVKCHSFADERHWYLSVTVKVSDELGQQILTQLYPTPKTETLKV